MQITESRKMPGKIESYINLTVYQKAFTMQQEIFEITKNFPKDELFSLTDQIRRSSRAIGANIAEAWQKRRYIAHFISKLTDSDGELAETRHWLDTALKCGYISADMYEALTEQCKEVGKMLGAIIAKPEKFCVQMRK